MTTQCGQIVRETLYSPKTGRAWYKRGSGDWNGSHAADPAKNIGGINLQTYTFAHYFIPFACTGGNGNNLYCLSFGGWPSHLGGDTKFDADTIQGFGGTGGTLADDDTTFLGSPVTSGVACDPLDALNTGTHTLTWITHFHTFFFTNWGMGLMKVVDDQVAANFAFFVDDGNWSSSDQWGGTLYNSNAPSISDSDLFANGWANVHNFERSAVNVQYTGYFVLYNGDITIDLDSVQADFGIGEVGIHIINAAKMAVTDIQAVEIITYERGNITLKWSDDAGASWSNGIQKSSGEVGEYLTNMQFQRLGMARNRVFEISWSGSKAESLQGVVVIYEIAGS